VGGDKYQQAYETAALELELLLREQERIKGRILSLRRTMASLGELVREAGDGLHFPDQADFRIEAVTTNSLTDDIRQIISASSDPFTSRDIRVELQNLGRDLAEQKNPLATINALLNRLVEQGFVTETRKNNRKAWKRNQN